MAAAGGGGDAALDALRARVVAAGGPAGATLQVATEFMRFANAPPPEELAEEYDDTVDDSPPEDADAAA